MIFSFSIPKIFIFQLESIQMTAIIQKENNPITKISRTFRMLDTLERKSRIYPRNEKKPSFTEPTAVCVSLENKDNTNEWFPYQLHPMYGSKGNNPAIG